VPSLDLPVRADLAVVGAGIVGLAHAFEAHRRGLSVVVVERDARPVGASVRNFGHGCVTAQDGTALDYALAARSSWLELARQAGFWVRESGTVVVARADDERAVLEELAERRDGQVCLLDARRVEDRLGPVPGAVAGAFFPLDVRIDPRSAVPATAGWLATQGVRFLWSTSVRLIEPGRLVTSRGDVVADRIVVAVGHHLDRHYPELASTAGLRRCVLHMLRVAAPNGRRIEPAVFTGLSMLRYPAFQGCRSLPALRERIGRERPDLLDADVNLMLTQHPDGDLLIGDTHAYATTPDPFQAEELDELLLSEAAELLGAGPLTVRQRWRGVYASIPDREFLIVEPSPGVRAVSITSGIGMTTALGLAPRVLDDLLA
jgi:FAD dependent oxidoreductase TIGR03364